MSKRIRRNHFICPPPNCPPFVSEDLRSDGRGQNAPQARKFWVFWGYTKGVLLILGYHFWSLENRTLICPPCFRGSGARRGDRWSDFSWCPFLNRWQNPPNKACHTIFQQDFFRKPRLVLYLINVFSRLRHNWERPYGLFADFFLKPSTFTVEWTPSPPPPRGGGGGWGSRISANKGNLVVFSANKENLEFRQIRSG